jgi:hypothetical protein
MVYVLRRFYRRGRRFEVLGEEDAGSFEAHAARYLAARPAVRSVDAVAQRFQPLGRDDFSRA